MKKLLFVLALSLLFVSGNSVYAYAEEDTDITETAVPEDNIPATGELSSECGADGYITMYLYVSDDNNASTTRVVFFNTQTKKDYFFKFDPVNYDDNSLWIENINIPQGEYLVSCRVTGDAYGYLHCLLHPGTTKLTVDDSWKKVICLIGSEDWVNAMNERFINEQAKPTVPPTPTEVPTQDPEAPNTTPGVENPADNPTQTPSAGGESEIEKPIPVPKEEPEEPVEKEGGISDKMMWALIIVPSLAVLFLFLKKKK